MNAINLVIAGFEDMRETLGPTLVAQKPVLAQTSRVQQIKQQRRFDSCATG